MLEISLKAEQLFSIGNFGVTNGLLLGLIVSLILIIFSFVFIKKIKLIPGKVQGAVEMIIEMFLGLMESVLGSKEKAEKYLPLVLTIFVFILLSNWSGIVPGVGSFFLREGEKSVPLLRSPAADLNFTLAFAVMAVLVTNFFGVTILGFFKHFKKFLNFSNPVNFFVGILEFLSEMAKFISFSFRLFGNIFAGEVLLTIMFFLVPYIVPIPFMMLEMFFGAIQAFVFAMLTLVFLTLHTTEHSSEH
ncbi:MAG: F0F1 ATP synthase subunit A [Candidatus Staskawiczbacteria bacterium]|nr:F0F1 ATP synthase subunit A [Candidatus Staskawiczbacteria bacterium]